MKVLLVWPNKTGFGMKPISLALLSALLKQRHHEVELFDTTFIDLGYQSNTEVLSKLRNFKEVDFGRYDVSKKKVDLRQEFIKKLDTFRPDIVGFSVLSDEVEISHTLSGIVKEWNKKTFVVWGNKAPTMGAEIILKNPNVDCACIGEGIEYINELAQCLGAGVDFRVLGNIAFRNEQGQVQFNPMRPYFQDLDSLPYLDWSIFDSRHFLKPYNGKVYVGGDHMIQWGCPNECTYCINHAYRALYGSGAGRFLRRYEVDRIIEELQFLVDQWKLEFLKFNDEDFCLKPVSYLTELAEKYQSRIGLPFAIMSNACNITPEKIKLLKKMNCVSVSIGIENGNADLRKRVLKRKETKEDIIRAVKGLNDAGIRTSSFNMLGIPFETRSTVMETIALNRESEVLFPTTVFFYPLENTELRKISIEHGFFDYNNDTVWDDIRPNLRLPGITEEELIALRERFVLYIKMPEAYRKYIERSEQRDNVGQKLTDALFKLYDDCVLAHDGRWNDRGRNNDYLNQLEDIYLDNNEKQFSGKGSERG